MKILNVEPLRYDDQTRALLKNVGETDYINVLKNDELAEVVIQKPYEAIFVKLGLSIDKKIMELMPALKYIVTPTTGLNHINLECAKQRNIEVISLKGETKFLDSIKSTAEHTWMLLLALIRKLPSAFEDVKNYNWRREPFLGSEINGKTLGIIGYGRLGKIVANYGLAFGANVIINDIDPKKNINLPEGIQSVNLIQLLQKSDIISIHIPSDETNFQFVGKDLISQMKTGVILVNTSRGEVVEENAILEALNNKKIAGYAADVLDGDSSWEGKMIKSQPLVEYANQHDNLIITPHIGGYALESILATRSFIVSKFINAILVLKQQR